MLNSMMKYDLRAESCRPFKVCEPLLDSYWSGLIKAGENKWNWDGSLDSCGEGECVAQIILKDGRLISGEFVEGKYHAEINALIQAGVFDAESMEVISGQTENVLRINISSPPCLRCNIILESLSLSDKVHLNGEKGKIRSRACPSGDWPSGHIKALVQLITLHDETQTKGLTSKEIKEYMREIYLHFMSIG